MGDQIVRVFADPPHLLKNIRNALVNYDFELPDSIVKKYNLPSNLVKMDHIKQLYEYELRREDKLAPRLSKDCVFVKGFNKMNVNFARNALSRDVAAALRSLVTLEKFPQEVLTTAFFCERIGKWYDLATARAPHLGFSLSKPEKLDSALDFLDEMMYIMDTTMFYAHQKLGRPDIVRGFLLSTTSLKELVNSCLSGKGYKFVLSGRFTSDCIENYFSQVRRKNLAPTPLEFIKALRVLTFLQTMKPSQHGSYEEDEEAVWLTELRDVKQMEAERAAEAEEDAEEDEDDIVIAEWIAERDLSQHLAQVYVMGCVLAKTICKRRGSFCKTCMDIFTQPEGTEDLHAFIKEKEWCPGSLVYPSPTAMKIFTMMYDNFMEYRDRIQQDKKIIQKIIDTLYLTIREKYPEIPHCHLDVILNRWFDFRMFFLAKYLNSYHIARISKRLKGSANGSKSMAGHYVDM